MISAATEDPSGPASGIINSIHCLVMASYVCFSSDPRYSALLATLYNLLAFTTGLNSTSPAIQASIGEIQTAIDAIRGLGVETTATRKQRSSICTQLQIIRNSTLLYSASSYNHRVFRR